LHHQATIHFGEQRVFPEYEIEYRGVEDRRTFVRFRVLDGEWKVLPIADVLCILRGKILLDPILFPRVREPAAAPQPKA